MNISSFPLFLYCKKTTEPSERENHLNDHGLHKGETLVKKTGFGWCFMAYQPLLFNVKSCLYIYIYTHRHTHTHTYIYIYIYAHTHIYI